MPKSSRIGRGSDLSALLTQGKRRRTDHLDLFLRPSPVGCSRLAVIVPRFRQTAVERNRLRRRLREIGRRQVLPVLADPTDIAVRARPRAYAAGFETLRGEFVESACRSSHESAS